MTADGSPSMPSSLSRCLVVVRLNIQSVSLVCIDPNQSRTHPLGSTTAHNLILARPVLIGRPTLLAADEHDVRTGWLLWEAPSRRPCWRRHHRRDIPRARAAPRTCSLLRGRGVLLSCRSAPPSRARRAGRLSRRSKPWPVTAARTHALGSPPVSCSQSRPAGLLSRRLALAEASVTMACHYCKVRARAPPSIGWRWLLHLTPLSCRLSTP